MTVYGSSLDKGLKPSVILCKIPNLITSGQFKKITSSPSPAGNKASVCSDKAGIELLNILSNHLLPHFSPWPSGKRRLFFSFCNNIEPAFNLRSAKCREQESKVWTFLFSLFFLICVCQFYCASPDCNTRLSLCVHLPFTLLCWFYTARGKKIDFCCHLVHHAQVCRLPVSLETSEPRSTSQPSLTPNEPFC